MMKGDGALWFKANWDRMLGWTVLAGGGLFLVVGTARIMEARYLVDQLSILMSGGLVGLACVAFGTGLLVMASHQEEWRRLDRLEETVRAATGGGEVTGTGPDVRGTQDRRPVEDAAPESASRRSAMSLGEAR